MFVPRGRCKSGCVDFVDRPDGVYPHRQYQPDVVARAVAAVVVGGATPAKAAATVEASTTSVRRWTRWVAKLVDVAAVLALAGQLCPAGVAGAGLAATTAATSNHASAARVLHALEMLGEALLESGAKLISKSGLGRLLEWQHRTQGDVIHMVSEPRSFSPGMALGGQGVPV
jgi:transposase-like protein